MSKLSRRKALRLGLLGAIGAGIAAAYSRREGLRFIPGLARGEWLRIAGGQTAVGIVRCPTYADAREAVRAAWDLVGGPPLAGRRVVLKPNLVDHLPDRQVHTAPEMLVAAAEYARQKGAAEVVVADGPCFNRDTEQLLADTGFGDALSAHGIPFVDLNYDDLDDVALSGNYGGRITRLLLPRTITRADVVVSIPKMKTHHWAGVSLSMKNLFGVVPGIKYGWPKNTLHVNGMTASILALHDTVRPRLALVDGVVGLEGDGPLHGSPRSSGVLLIGTDLVAVDSTAARVMGMAPEQIGYLRAAAALGMGRLAEGQIEVRGGRVADFIQPYRPAPSDLLLASGTLRLRSGPRVGRSRLG